MEENDSSSDNEVPFGYSVKLADKLKYDILKKLGYFALITTIGGPLVLFLPPASAFLVLQIGNYQKVIGIV